MGEEGKREGFEKPLIEKKAEWGVVSVGMGREKEKRVAKLEKKRSSYWLRPGLLRSCHMALFLL